MDEPRFFETPAAFRDWLEANHESATELQMGFHRKSSGRPSITWPEAVDAALCYGWIDSIRRSIDSTSYMNRFTPRKASSHWSAVNIARVAELTELGLMRPAGLRAFARRDPARADQYSYERANAELDGDHLRQLQATPAAWDYFRVQPAGYRKVASWFVVSAKRPETRQRRLDTLIGCCERGQRLPQSLPPKRR